MTFQNKIGMEPLNPKKCLGYAPNFRALNYSKFKTDTPVFSNVKIIERFAYYDGVRSGVCIINGEKFLFNTLLFDIWRYYDKQQKAKNSDKAFQVAERLWSIYAVYDAPINTKTKKLCCSAKDMDDEYNVIGIFWDYKDEAGQ